MGHSTFDIIHVFIYICNVPAGWFWARFQISPPLSSSPRSPPILGRWDQNEELLMARVFWAPPRKIANWWGKCKKSLMKMRMFDMVLSCSVFFWEVTSKMRISRYKRDNPGQKKGYANCPVPNCGITMDTRPRSPTQHPEFQHGQWLSETKAKCVKWLEMKNGNSP